MNFGVFSLKKKKKKKNLKESILLCNIFFITENSKEKNILPNY